MHTNRLRNSAVSTTPSLASNAQLFKRRSILLCMCDYLPVVLMTPPGAIDLFTSQGSFLMFKFVFCVQSQTQGDTDKSKAQLVAKKRRTSRSSGKYGDILLWGDLIVYTSPDEAIASLSSDDVDDQRVRLVKIADNAQLRIMLEAGVELCGAGAALYLRVDPSCPIYWGRWDTCKTNADLDIVCGIPHRGSRDSVLALVHVKSDGTGGVRVRHARNKPTESSAGREQQRLLLVYSGCGRIVGTREFAGRPSTRGDGSGEEEEGH